MTTTNELPNPAATTARPPVAGAGEHVSINDNLPSSSPSGKTVLKVLAGVLGVIALIVLYGNTIGF
jgi:hypothetical protein